jgi:hypothetical protein
MLLLAVIGSGVPWGPEVQGKGGKTGWVLETFALR